MPNDYTGYRVVRCLETEGFASSFAKNRDFFVLKQYANLRIVQFLLNAPILRCLTVVLCVL
jgi:hypothetical protein